MRVLSCLLAILIVACGGDGAAEPEGAASAGGEEEQAVEEEADEDEEDEEEEEEARATGPATITFKLTVAGEEIKGTIKIRNDTGDVIAEGEAGSSLSVPSGIYRSEVRADKSGLVDSPMKWVEIDLKPGSNPVQEVQFPWAMVLLNVKVNGKTMKGKVELLRRGKSVVTLPIGGTEHAMISPGRYQGKIKTRRSEIEVPQIVIPEGAKRNVPINVTW